MPQNRRLEQAAQRLKLAQRLVEEAVFECHHAGFEHDEIALILRVPVEWITETLTNPRQYRD